MIDRLVDNIVEWLTPGVPLIDLVDAVVSAPLSLSFIITIVGVDIMPVDISGIPPRKRGPQAARPFFFTSHEFR